MNKLIKILASLIILVTASGVSGYREIALYTNNDTLQMQGVVRNKGLGLEGFFLIIMGNPVILNISDPSTTVHLPDSGEYILGYFLDPAILNMEEFRGENVTTVVRIFRTEDESHTEIPQICSLPPAHTSFPVSCSCFPLGIFTFLAGLLVLILLGLSIHIFKRLRYKTVEIESVLRQNEFLEKELHTLRTEQAGEVLDSQHDLDFLRDLTLTLENGYTPNKSQVETSEHSVSELTPGPFEYHRGGSTSPTSTIFG